MKPPAASSRAYSGVMVSGLASVVTSAPGAIPNRSTAAWRMRTRSAAGRSVGVPPPKNTVCSGRAGTSEDASTSAAKSSSATADSQ